MIPAEYNGWTIYQDSIFQKTITYPARDLTGGTFAMEIVKAGTVIIALTSANGRITSALNGSDTEITLRIDADDTQALSNFNIAQYDLEYTPSTGAADKERFLYGTIAFNGEVTTA